MSSELKLNVLSEFVTKASITLKSTPDSASLISSAVGAVGLTFGGSGASVETTLTGASEVALVGGSATSAISSGAGSAAGTLSFSGLLMGAAISEELVASCKQP